MEKSPHLLFSENATNAGSMKPFAVNLISATCPQTAASITSFIDFWETGDQSALELFRPWWGRGTQYISVTRS
jgi:hypothetical protein